MFAPSDASCRPDYDALSCQLTSLLEGERDLIANAAQFSAFIMQTIADLNWAGFYFARPLADNPGHELVLGPFQGKVACVRIPFGRGVCGAAAIQRQTLRVDNVHTFPGHIACDSASNAEIVLPLIKDDVLYGVFDIDSPHIQRFTTDDQSGLEKLLARFVAATDFR